MTYLHAKGRNVMVQVGKTAPLTTQVGQPLVPERAAPVVGRPYRERIILQPRRHAGPLVHARSNVFRRVHAQKRLEMHDKRQSL